MDNFDAKVLNESNPDLANDLFMENYSQIFNKKFPLIANKAREESNPWFGQELLQLMSQKDKLYKKFIAEKAIASQSRYSIARNVYNHFLKTKKEKYFGAVFGKYEKDLKKTRKNKNHNLG